MKRNKSIMTIGSIIVAGSLLASCASSTGALQRATASKIEGAKTADVQVSNIDRGVASVSWDASYQDKQYHCDADDMVRTVNCTKDK